MNAIRINIKVLAAILCCSATFAQGVFSPGVGAVGSDAIYKDFFAITGWANECQVFRGYMDIANKSLGLVGVGSEQSGIGVVDGNVVSLGDSGVAILSFN